MYYTQNEILASDIKISLISGPKLELYINGKVTGKITSYKGNSGSSTNHPNLIFGAGSLFPLINDQWNMHIDDFAIWANRYLTSDEAVHIMNKGREMNVYVKTTITFEGALWSQSVNTAFNQSARSLAS